MATEKIKISAEDSGEEQAAVPGKEEAAAEKKAAAKPAAKARKKAAKPAVKKTTSKKKAPARKIASKGTKVKIGEVPMPSVPAVLPADAGQIPAVAAPSPEAVMKNPKDGQREIAPQAINSLNEPASSFAKRLSEKLAQPAKPEGTAEAELAAVPAHLGLYKKIAYSFAVLTLALIAFASYFFLVKLKIVILPNQERISNSLIFDVNDSDLAIAPSEGSIAGIVKKISVEETRSYPATGVKVIGEGVVGTVAIVNKYDKNQTLVATTRLLTADGTLFRLKETVFVPAGGQLEAKIYADKPNRDMAINPAKMTFPGLWAGLQDKIYAESKEVIKFQEEMEKNVAQTDIDNGLTYLKKALVEKVKIETGEKYGDYDQVLYKIDDNAIESAADAQAGDKKDSFSITMKTAVYVIAFKDEPIFRLAKNKMATAIPDGKELSEFNRESIIYNLNSVEADRGTASVNANFEGKMILKNDASIVDRQMLVGLDRDQLSAILNAIPEISGYELQFTPSFVDLAPKLVDKITVEVRR